MSNHTQVVQPKRQPCLIRRAAPIAVLLAAFFLQLTYLSQLRAAFPDTFIDQPFCGVDAVAHHNRALGLLSGQYPGERPWSFIPLYPFFIAGLYQWPGFHFYLPVLIQAMLNLTAVAALIAIGRTLFSWKVGLLAGLALGAYPSLLYYMACFDQALLTVPLMTLAVFFLLRFQARQRLVWLLLAGLLIGLGALSRPTVLAVLPAAALWLFLYRLSLRRFIWYAACLGVMAAIPVFPFVWHNYQASGAFILIKTSGVNFFTGNNPDATGLDSMALAQSQPPVLRYIEFQERLKRGETSFAGEILGYIRQQPGDWLELTATKVWLWFGEADRPITSPYFPLDTTDSALLKRLPVEWQAAALAALLGLFLVRSRNRQAAVLIWMVYGLFSLATIIFFVSLRFRLPLVPAVLLYAMALATAGERWACAAPRRFWAVLLILLGAYLVLPGLWIFILLFAGLGLWSALRPGGSTLRRWVLLAVWSYLVVGGFWLQAWAAATDVSQSIAHYLGPPLVGDGVLGQTIHMDCNGFNRLAIKLGVFDETHDQPVIFTLATDIGGQEILFSEEFDGSEVRDHQWWVFTFGPLPDSRDRTYFFFITSPTSTLENSLTARGYTDTPVDPYRGGQGYAGALEAVQPIQADFAFLATCDQSLRRRLAAGVEKMAAAQLWGPAHKGFYWAMLGLHSLLLGAAAVGLSRQAFYGRR